MQEPVLVSTRNAKLLELNFSESQTQSQNDEREKELPQKSIDLLKNSQQNLAKQQSHSKSTNPEELKDQSQPFQHLAVKTSPLFNFKDKTKQLHQVSQYESEKSHIAFGRKPTFSGKLRRMSGNRNEKCLKNQQKKIQFMNNSVLMHDVQQIKFSPAPKNKKFLIEGSNEQFKQLPRDILSSNLSSKRSKEKLKEKLMQEDKHNHKQQIVADRKEDKEMREKQEQQSEGVESENESISENPQCIFNAGIKFKEVVYHDFDSQNSEQQGQVQPKSDLPSQNLQESEIQPISVEDIFSPKFRSESYRKMRNQFLQLLLNNEKHPWKSSENVKKLLTTPIPANNMFEFQVHLYKDLFKTQFQLWVKYHSNRQEETFMIASASNESFHIDKTIFVIQQVNHLNERQFIGELESNFARNFYQLFGFGPQSAGEAVKGQAVKNMEQQKIEAEELMNISLDGYRIVYISELTQRLSDRYQAKKNESKDKAKNLSEKYRLEKFVQSSSTSSVRKLIISKPLNNFDKVFKVQNGVRKSAKTLLLRDSCTRTPVFFIGKIASKKYKLMVGEGICPLQAFGVTIAHVESN